MATIPVDMVALGRRLQSVREERGLAATRLDERAGVGRGTVHRIEHGDRPEISIAVVARIARALGIRLDWLVWGEERDGVTTAPAGLDAPIAGFLNALHRLPGLMEWVEGPGASATIQSVALGVKAYREQRPKCGPDGKPVQGWSAFFEQVAHERAEAAAGIAEVVPIRTNRRRPRATRGRATSE